MKIGDLFIALGFKVEGGDKLAEVEKNIQGAAIKASALALAVNAINYAFLRMMDAARASAVEFKNFAQATGLSTDELKQWQAAAAKNDVSAKEMAGFIEGLQQRVSEIQLGRGNIAPFQMLGVLPSRDTFAMLKQLSAGLRQLPPDMARVIAADLGANSAMLGFLRQQNLELGRLEQHFRLRESEQAGLIKLNQAWQQFVFLLASARDKLASVFAPALAAVVRLLSVVVGWLAKFADWINKDTVAARAMRAILVYLVAVFMGLGVVLAAVAAALGLVTAAMTALDLAAFPIVAVMAEIAAGVLVVVAALTALFLLIDDLATAAGGGKSFFKWPISMLANMRTEVELLAKALTTVLALWARMNDVLTKPGPGLGIYSLLHPELLAQSLIGSRSGNSTSIKQESNVRVYVDGSKSPAETGRAVAEEMQGIIGGAAYQMPLPNN